MKAAFLVAAKKFDLRDVADPQVPPDGLLLKVEACGICGSDLRRWREGPPQNVDGIIPGHEVSGVVEQVGKDLAEYSVGDRLAVAPDIHCGKCYYCRRALYNLCDEIHFLGVTPGYAGGFAEKMLITHEVLTNGIVHAIPDGLSSLNAAVAEPSCSVLALHTRIGTGLGDTVVVMGAGPIGCLHVVIAKSRGASVVVSEPNQTRCEMVQRFDPAAVVNPNTDDLVACVRKHTNRVGADIVICANPVAQTVTQAVEIVRRRGKVVLFGGLPKTDPMVCLHGNLIHYGEIEVIGAFSYHPTMHELALDLLSRKVIPAELLITHTFALQDIDRAFDVASSGEALKVVVTT